MTNYASHVKDAGRDPNTAAGLLPQGIGLHQRSSRRHRKPHHVRLLDYEVEIGLVIGRDMPVGTAITEANLSTTSAGWW